MSMYSELRLFSIAVLTSLAAIACAELFMLPVASEASPAQLSAQPDADGFIDILSVLPTAQRAAIVAGRDVDSTVAIQNAFRRYRAVKFPAGQYNISRTLVLGQGQQVRLSPGAKIRQRVKGQGGFAATAQADVVIELNGGQLVGPGGWTKVWRGNQGWEGYRGIQCTGCTNFRVTGPGQIVNWGHAAIAVIGGSGYTISGVTIEGTHRYGAPLTREDNFQNGIYIANDRRWGRADDGRISTVNISGVAQGILREALPQAPAPQMMTVIDSPFLHDIPGQHGIYNQDGKLQVRGGNYVNLALSAVKFQAADANRDLYDISATGIRARNIGGAMFEVAALGTGVLNRIDLEGQGVSVGSLLSLNGPTRDFVAKVSGSGIKANAVYVLGRNIQRASIQVDAQDIDQDGVLITATDAQLSLNARIANPNLTRVVGNSGIRIVSRNALITLNNPVVTDANGRMAYALYNETDGARVSITGTMTATGAKDTAVRADGRVDGVTTNAVLRGAKGRTSGRYEVR
jgi:hypothetical protein